MRKLSAFLLLLLLCLRTGSAGVNSQQAKYSGGTTSTLPIGANGTLSAKDETHLQFTYKAGKNKEIGSYPAGDFSLPYLSVTRLIYGETKHLRIGQTIALAALAGVGGLLLLLSKSRTHYLTVESKDDKNLGQVVSFEVGKDAIRPLLAALELRTGKKCEYEQGLPVPAKKNR